MYILWLGKTLNCMVYFDQTNTSYVGIGQKQE